VSLFNKNCWVKSDGSLPLSPFPAKMLFCVFFINDLLLMLVYISAQNMCGLKPISLMEIYFLTTIEDILLRSWRRVSKCLRKQS